VGEFVRRRIPVRDVFCSPVGYRYIILPERGGERTDAMWVKPDIPGVCHDEPGSAADSECVTTSMHGVISRVLPVYA
jgi:hypothetical protein